jgi:hypothetical protein
MTSDNDLERCVTLHELSLRNCPQGFEHVGFGQIKKRATESHSDKWIRSKRQKGRLRQTRLHSEPFDSLPSSRQSTPSATVVSLDLKENVPENLDNVDLASTNTVHKHRDLMQIDIENKPREKVRSRSNISRPRQMNFNADLNSSLIYAHRRPLFHTVPPITLALSTVLHPPLGVARHLDLIMTMRLMRTETRLRLAKKYPQIVV